MKVTVIGKQHIEGISKKTGRPFNANIAHIIRSDIDKGVVSALDRLEKKYNFPSIFKSITVDNGSEFADCYGMEHDKDGNKRTTVYYCHPYGSCEKGSCENHNKIIRRFIPKGISMRKITQSDCNRIADWMNNLPRRVLGYKSPAFLFNQKVARLRLKKIA